MKNFHYLLRMIVLLGTGFVVAPASADAECPAMFNFETRLLRSDESVNFCEVFGRAPAVLVVNTASQCGYTPQFKGLESLYRKYRDQGLVVVGFPSDDFNQEFSSEAKTAEVCHVNYGVTFPMMATSSVRGNNAIPLFKALTEQTQAPGWNFNKYLITPGNGQVQHFGSSRTPAALDEVVSKALKSS